ncbi:GDSL-type esterase/lipase family protein [Thalassotalea mangrovi]|uniref:Arylesterase n=1 Tax=Thalassotalea mangrovi TaxID=2572245 RepID=A0A4U1B4K7_9GAMM|nr:GDSL-type esterase/lipase family protein [Thalassotalea mangrovi]TKB45117.1 arylesterase [Thalassotalea mangrovi]
MLNLITIRTTKSAICGFTIGLIMLMTAGCGGPQLQPLGNDATILAFGDSLTSGKGVSNEHSYPSVLQQMTGINVVNGGVSGEVTSEGLARLPEYLDAYPVDLLILIEGGNDILKNMDLDQTHRNLDEMIQMAKKRGIDVVLFGIPKKSLFSDSADFYHQLADKHDLIFDDEIIASMLRTPELKSDSVHFNQQGYYQLAQRAHQLLKEHGAL